MFCFIFLSFQIVPVFLMCPQFHGYVASFEIAGIKLLLYLKSAVVMQLCPNLFSFIVFKM